MSLLFSATYMPSTVLGKLMLTKVSEDPAESKPYTERKNI